MKLAELKEIAKTRGLPSSGNKAALIQTITNASSAPSGGGKAKAAPQPAKPSKTEVRVGVQLDSATVAAMGLKLTGASTDMNGQPEYVYTKIGAAKSSGSAVRISAGGIGKGAIDKKGKKQKTDKKASASRVKKVSDDALEEAVGCFVERLDEKKVPVELCRQFLKHFLDDDEIPKQKTKVDDWGQHKLVCKQLKEGSFVQSFVKDDKAPAAAAAPVPKPGGNDDLVELD